MKVRAYRICFGCVSSLIILSGCGDIPPTLGRFAISSTAAKGAGSLPVRLPAEFRLRMHHLHTGESINIVYRIGSWPVQSAVDKLNHFLRDWRTDEDGSYSLQEFDLLHALLHKLHRDDGVIDVICGYRSMQTNQMLRAGNPATGVAESSQHMLSRAIDIRIPGVSTISLRNAALSLGRGGVGYYPQSHFVHVDVGPLRQWSHGGRLSRVNQVTRKATTSRAKSQAPAARAGSM